jgi:hypothetical protein
MGQNPYPVEIADSGGGPVKTAGDLTFTDPGNQPGGSMTPVGVVAVSLTQIDIHATGFHQMAFTQLRDNTYSQNVIDAFPEGLGLSFPLDGGLDNTITIGDEDGIWSFSLQTFVADDATVAFYLDPVFPADLADKVNGPGITGDDFNDGYIARQDGTLFLPAGATVNPGIRTCNAATANPYHAPADASGTWLAITRLG